MKTYFIAETVDRLLQAGAARGALCSSAQSPTSDVDAQRTAVLILAALHGGSILSQLAQDPRPLYAALDLALLPLVATEDSGVARAGTSGR